MGCGMCGDEGMNEVAQDCLDVVSAAVVGLLSGMLMSHLLQTIGHMSVDEMTARDATTRLLYTILATMLYGDALSDLPTGECDRR